MTGPADPALMPPAATFALKFGPDCCRGCETLAHTSFGDCSRWSTNTVPLLPWLIRKLPSSDRYVMSSQPCMSSYVAR